MSRHYPCSHLFSLPLAKATQQVDGRYTSLQYPFPLLLSVPFISCFLPTHLFVSFLFSLTLCTDSLTSILGEDVMRCILKLLPCFSLALMLILESHHQVIPHSSLLSLLPSSPLFSRLSFSPLFSTPHPISQLLLVATGAVMILKTPSSLRLEGLQHVMDSCV